MRFVLLAMGLLLATGAVAERKSLVCEAALKEPLFIWIDIPEKVHGIFDNGSMEWREYRINVYATSLNLRNTGELDRATLVLTDKDYRPPVEYRCAITTADEQLQMLNQFMANKMAPNKI